ncbi:MAG: glycosyltransferase family 4 protein [Ferruginibacter sp.]|jgi:glycosyltransferase involved in cell wall biosynthesis
MKPTGIKKKKILHTTTRLVLGGGVEKNIYYTIANLSQQFEFHLSCGVECKDDLFCNHPEIKMIVCPYLVNTIHPLKDLQALWFYYRLIRKEKYDIVHTHETKASFITKLAAWLARCPYVIYGLHGVTFNDPMSRLKRNFYILLEKLTIYCADLVVAVGKDTVDEYKKERIGKKIPFEIVRSGIDIDSYMRQAIQTTSDKILFRQSLGIEQNDIVFITVGRFSYSKAQRYAIEAFATLQKKYDHVKFLLIGEGELLAECKLLAESAGINENAILFLGYQKDIPKYLSVSDIFIFTSLREGLPRVIVEASLLQVPVLTFEVEGATEVLENEKSGFIVPQTDKEALVNKAEQLILQPELRILFGKRAQQHVIQHWDMHVMAQQLQIIYNRTN